MMQMYGELPVNFVTAPGWLMCVSWGLYLLLILLFFKEPDRSTTTFSRRGSSHSNPDAMADDNSVVDSATSSNPALQAPLLPGNGHNNNTSRISVVQLEYLSDELDSSERAADIDDSEYNNDDKAVQTVRELLKELTRPVKILLWIYFMLKFASELLISESSILTDHYFHWKTSQVKF